METRLALTAFSVCAGTHRLFVDNGDIPVRRGKPYWFGTHGTTLRVIDAAGANSIRYKHLALVVAGCPFPWQQGKAGMGSMCKSCGVARIGTPPSSPSPAVAGEGTSRFGTTLYSRHRSQVRGVHAQGSAMRPGADCVSSPGIAILGKAGRRARKFNLASCPFNAIAAAQKYFDLCAVSNRKDDFAGGISTLVLSRNLPP